jgi:predicted glycoside hydrolase/deacetylase ChbG (UPF0249 family)
MANGAAFDEAVRLAKENPSLDVGVHFVLAEGPSVLKPGRMLPANVGDLVGLLVMQRIDVAAELRAQVQKILAAGIRPTHFDTHKHTHLLPPVLNAIAHLAEEFKVHWLRRPFDFPISGSHDAIPLTTRAISAAFGAVRGHFKRTLARHGCATTDWFAGFQLTGHVNSASVIRLFNRLPAGTTEFMVHPGFCTAELRAAHTRLKESRERELQALVDPAVREAVVRNRIQLKSYRDLPLPF